MSLRRFTTDEIDEFPADGNRYELLDGVVFVTPAPGVPPAGALPAPFLTSSGTTCPSRRPDAVRAVNRDARSEIG